MNRINLQTRNGMIFSHYENLLQMADEKKSKRANLYKQLMIVSFLLFLYLTSREFVTVLVDSYLQKIEIPLSLSDMQLLNPIGTILSILMLYILIMYIKACRVVDDVHSEICKAEQRLTRSLGYNFYTGYKEIAQSTKKLSFNLIDTIFFGIVSPIILLLLEVFYFCNLHIIYFWKVTFIDCKCGTILHIPTKLMLSKWMYLVDLSILILIFTCIVLYLLYVITSMKSAKAKILH